jgi:hypothetical protein
MYLQIKSLKNRLQRTREIEEKPGMGAGSMEEPVKIEGEFRKAARDSGKKRKKKIKIFKVRKTVLVYPSILLSVSIS